MSHQILYGAIIIASAVMQAHEGSEGKDIAKFFWGLVGLVSIIAGFYTS